jgi:hypothetical protein
MRKSPFALLALAVRVAHAEPEHATAFDEAVKLRGIGEYALAAAAFERFARERPDDESAPKALTDAIALNMALGDDRKAYDDADRYVRAYASRTDDAAKVALAVLLHASDREDWATVEREAQRKMVLVERGPAAFAVVGHALLARAYAKHPGDGRASTEYARVRSLAEHVPQPTGDGEAIRWWARGADAFGEALVFAADERRDASSWAAFPTYARGDVSVWIASAVTPWATSRGANIRALTDEYAKVLKIEPAPPPSRVVDAASRVAMMWTRATDEMFAHVPPHASKAFMDALSHAAENLRSRAKEAAQTCVAMSVKYQWTNDGTRACAAWLERTFRREFPPLDELLVTPQLRAGNPVDVAPVRP